MLEYDRIDVSEGIGVDSTNKSKECMLCHYWYFIDKNFSYGPYLCDGCYDIMQKSLDFRNIVIVYVKKVHTEFIFCIWVNVRQKIND